MQDGQASGCTNDCPNLSKNMVFESQLIQLYQLLIQCIVDVSFVWMMNSFDKTVAR